nr:hypothetical protein [Tanacetum cinerariifolium]
MLRGSSTHAYPFSFYFLFTLTVKAFQSSVRIQNLFESSFDEDEINSDKLDPHCFNVESDFVESLLNRDTFIDFSSKFDFSGELAHIKPKIPKSDFDFEEEIYLIKNLLYDNSFPRPPEEFNAKIADTIVESIPLLPIPVQDGNSQQKEIDIVTETDDLLPRGIENVGDDPEGDIRFLEELLIDDSILSDELSDANFEENSSIPRPPPEPPDAEIDAGEEIQVVMIDKDKFDDDYQIFMFDKEVEFEETPTRIHMVKRFLFGRKWVKKFCAFVEDLSLLIYEDPRYQHYRYCSSQVRGYVL